MQGIENAVRVKPGAGSIDESRLIEEMSTLEAAVHIPSFYIQVLAGAKDSAVPQKEIGFIIRRSDIFAVRQYVRYAKLLPLDIKVITEKVGGVQGVELNPKNILEFHLDVVAHADTWGELERATKELSRELNKFSDGFLTTGKAILDIIDKVELGRFVTGTLDDLTDKEKETLGDIFFDFDELKAVDIIKDYVLEIKGVTESYIKKVDGVGALAAEFERVLSDHLIHQINRILKAHSDSGALTEHKDIVERLRELEIEIEELLADYKRQVGYSFTGLPFGAVGLAVTGGIFGSKAELTRARKNERIAERKILLSKKKDQERLIALLDQSHQCFGDLRGRMFAAEQGAKQLAQVWDYIAKYLGEAAEALDGIDTFVKLHQFKLDFKQLLNPWARVSDYTVQISNAFNDALEESR